MRTFRRLIRQIFAYSFAILTHILYFPYKWRLLLRGDIPPKLHVGCGQHFIDGWINSDINPKADLIVFLQRRIPLKDESLERIYLEHVLEHVPYETGIVFLEEARRTLRKGGVIRIAVPDLEDLIEGYYHNDWKRFDWVNWPKYSFIKTKAEMLNIAFRWWGHQHLYDREELTRALSKAGFVKFEFVERLQSEHEDLRGLETRLDSKLIVEATKS